MRDRLTNRGLAHGSAWLIACLTFLGCDGTPLRKLDLSLESQGVRKFSVDVQAYCPQPSSRYKQVYGINLSYIHKNGALELDYDHDGVSDIDEYMSGLDPTDPDTSSSGLGDLALFTLGVSDPQISCATAGADSNKDGLGDCARAALRLSPNSFSSADDGIPDFLKLRVSLDPRDASLASLNPVGDGIINSEKIRMGIPLLEVASPAILDSAVRTAATPTTGGCYDFAFSNIPLVNTDNGNLFRLYVVEQSSSGKWLLESKVLHVPLVQPADSTISVRYKEMPLQ